MCRPWKKIARNKTLPSADPATARGRAQPDVNRFPKYYSNDILYYQHIEEENPTLICLKLVKVFKTFDKWQH